MATTLSHFDAAKASLDKASSIDEVKEIRDKAEALRAYAKQTKAGLFMQNQCCEIKLRAERRGGEILSEQFPHGGDRRSESRLQGETLKDIGINKTQSHRWQTIAAMPERAFEEKIKDAKSREAELTGKEMYRAAKQSVAVTRPCKSIEESLGDNKFGCIYADPPWPYGNQGTRNATDNHYPTMAIEDIAAMPVKDYAADDAQLHLWTTNAFLFDSKAIMEAWGFAYKSMLVWVKPDMGMGNYWRVSHEFLLLGVRGRAAFPDDCRNIMSWVELPRGRHSEKPYRFRELVERVSQGPRLELFGRKEAKGWTVWGNEVEKEYALFTV